MPPHRKSLPAFFFLALCVLAAARPAMAETSSSFCTAINLWWEGSSLEQQGVRNAGERLCRKYSGSFCVDLTLGEGICRAGHGSECVHVGVGEGICRAAGGSACDNATIPEGICGAGRGSLCANATLAEGICRAFGGNSCTSADPAEWMQGLKKRCGLKQWPSNAIITANRKL